MQTIYDELYAKSKNGKEFYHLIDIISRPENIKLAYRNIRKNSGSKTAGVDKKTIKDLNKLKKNLFNTFKRNLSGIFHKRYVVWKFQKIMGKLDH